MEINAPAENSTTKVMLIASLSSQPLKSSLTLLSIDRINNKRKHFVRTCDSVVGSTGVLCRKHSFPPRLLGGLGD